jgi:hypothetical protein
MKNQRLLPLTCTLAAGAVFIEHDDKNVRAVDEEVRQLGPLPESMRCSANSGG